MEVLLDIQPSRSPNVPIFAHLSKVNSVDQWMRLGMRCRLSSTADVPVAPGTHAPQQTASLFNHQTKASPRGLNGALHSFAGAQVVPGVRRIELLGNIANPFSAFSWNEIKPAGPSLGLGLRLFTISELGEFPATFAAIKGDGSDALFVLSDALFNAARQEIASLLYYAQTPAHGTPKHKADARRQQFKRALDWAEAQGLIASHEINNVVYVLLCSRQAGDPDE